MKRLVFITLFLTIFSSFAQSILKGKVVDIKGQPILGVNVYDQITKKGAETDEKGNFKISFPKKTITLKASFIGFKTYVKEITLNNKTNYIKIVLKEDAVSLADIEIIGKTEGKITKEKAYEVAVLETKSLKNLGGSINTVLKGVSGVNIRESGGVGSSFEFSMNGLSGKQIKFFIDDIPMDNLGTSVSLNNFPVNLIERAEIYKGVVPIYLGSDALGGAVNIKTKQQNKSYLDASYNVGSFNTHTGAVLGQYYNDNLGFIARISSFYNYSDNSYKMSNIETLDDSGNVLDTINGIKRFHSGYESGMINVQTGIVNKKIADKFLIGTSFSANKKEIQHSQDYRIPFGALHTKEELNQLYVIYNNKKLLNKKLEVKLYGSMSENIFKRIDTVSYKYFWVGSEKLIPGGAVENGSYKSIFKMLDKSHLVNASMNFKINESNKLGVNYAKIYLKRSGEELYAKDKESPFSTPHEVDKHVLGIAYNIRLFNNKWKTSVFTKLYYLSVKGLHVNEFEPDDSPNRYQNVNNKFDNKGYGFASTYEFNKNLRVKTSFETAYRLPEGHETFGDGLFLLPNVKLKPEKSHNFNLGLLFEKQFSDNFRWGFEANGFYRDAKDLINSEKKANKLQYINRAKTKIIGIEGSTRFKYNNIELSLNVAKQKATEPSNDMGKKTKIPNMPFLFGNARVSYTPKNVFNDNDALGFSFTTNYVDTFPFQSHDSGDPDERIYVKEQLTHNFETNYSMSKGKYNMSFEIRNITDVDVYDNYNIQKAGRAIYFKLRYYLDEI